MKKVIASVMAILMLAALCACQTNVETQPSAPTEASSAASPSESTAASPSEGTAASPEDNQQAQSSITEKSMVDFEYTADPFSRDTYKMAYIMVFTSAYTSAMANCFELLGEKLNYGFSSFEAGGDNDKFLNLVEMAAGQGYDGLVIEGQTSTMDRIFEIMADYPDVQYIPGLSPFNDEEGLYYRPSVVVDSYNRGGAAVQYAIDDYKTYTNNDVDMADIGYATLNYSVITDFNYRVAGAFDKYKELYPDLVETNYFNVDAASETTPITADAAINQLTPVLAANRQFKGWIIYGCIENYGDGASLALETAGLDGVSVVVSDSAAMLIEKWNDGYDGCWVAGADTPQIQWADGIACGLLQLIEGTQTPETLWADKRAEGQNFTVIHLPYTVVNKDNAADYTQFMNTYLETKYPG
jgi:ABC-type sugar transport system substrate-binding protein